jgi:hypothetical protein
MVLDGLRGEIELIGDLVVCKVGVQLAEDLQFA